jgi:hypothetical protein
MWQEHSPTKNKDLNFIQQFMVEQVRKIIVNRMNRADWVVEGERIQTSSIASGRFITAWNSSQLLDLLISPDDALPMHNPITITRKK